MAHQDRRSAARYPAVEDRARVGWWEGKHFRTAAARIEDISTGGAAVALGPEAVTTPAVWLRLAGPGPDEWVQARLVGVATAEDGAKVARLAFPESCPYELFKAVAWGEPAAQSPRTAPGFYDTPAAPAADPPPTPTRRPARSSPEGPRDEAPACVVVVSMPFDALPTLCQAERSVRVSKDRVGNLGWVAAFLVGLTVAVLLGALVFEKLEGLRSIESFLKAPRP